MTPEQKRLVQQSFMKVAPIADQAASVFYAKLFALDPTLEPLFRSDMAEQEKKLMRMIGMAVNGLDNLDKLVPVMEDLGRRHLPYGVKADHYDTVGAALLHALGEGLGSEFTPAVKEAWAAVYGVLASTMKRAAYGAY